MHIIYKSHALNEIILFGFLYFQVFPCTFSEQLNELFHCFCFFDDLLKLHFFTRCFYFPHYRWWEKEKNQFFKYFWRILPKCEEKILEIHKQRWFLITWILKKSNSIQTLVEGIQKIKLSHWSFSLILKSTYSRVETSNAKRSIRFLCSWGKSYHIFFLLEVILK